MGAAHKAVKLCTSWTAHLGGVQQPGAAGLEGRPAGALLLLELLQGVAEAVERVQAAHPLRVVAAREIHLQCSSVGDCLHLLTCNDCVQCCLLFK